MSDKPQGDSLTPENFPLLADAFDRISALAPEARRDALESLAEQDPAVHRELLRMLDDHTAAADLEAGLDAIAADGRGAGGAGRKATSLSRGSLIDDRFRLDERLGAGGMGEVWSAEQLRPVARRVAVKILRQEHASRASAARLRAERQALATMDHPHIASVYDGGEIEGGEPYFVMELVPEGLPITAYADRHELGLEARLRLMLQVCEAVEHAHQKRIIHRDLKPSNVLVCEPAPGTRNDGPIVKVIDFGIAKPLADGLDDNGTTRVGELVGTPDYMSPEQATLGAVDIDTRSDVYSLGLLFYELLVGELPLGDELGRLPMDEQCRRIREDDAPRPSTRIRRLKTQAATAAATTSEIKAAGSVDIDWRTVRGDLDRIILAALAKDRMERYPSVAALADDVRRFLNHQPIQVAPQNLAYQARKFIRRHRLAVTLAVLAVLGGGVALASVSISLVRAQRAEALARTEAATTRQISEFLEGLLREGNPEEAEGAGSVRGLLDRGAERVRDELQDTPAVRGRLMLTIADAYRALGLYEPALELAEEGLASYRSMPRRAPEREAHALDVVTHILMNSRQHDRALETAREHHDLRIETLGEGHPDLADSHFQVGTAHWALGDFDRAKESLEEAVALRTTPNGPVHESLPRLQNNLAILYWQLARVDDAERLYREALESLRTLRGPDHPHVASTLNNLALVYERRGDFGQALEMHRQALAIRERIFEAPHPDLAESLNNIGTQLTHLDRQEEAREVLERALADRREIFGDGANDLVASTLFNLGMVMPEGGPRARQLFEESLAGLEGSLGTDHPMVAFPLLELAKIEQKAGRPGAALPLAQRAFELRQRGLPEGHPFQGEARKDLCLILRDLGRVDGAAELECDAIEDLETES
ncbi:MAG: serine/threonine-protein kinase [Acidobacteriota bacterium]